MQETQGGSQIWEDSTCCTAAKPMLHKPSHCNERPAHLPLESSPNAPTETQHSQKQIIFLKRILLLVDHYLWTNLLKTKWQANPQEKTGLPMTYSSLWILLSSPQDAHWGPVTVERVATVLHGGNHPLAQLTSPYCPPLKGQRAEVCTSVQACEILI